MEKFLFEAPVLEPFLDVEGVASSEDAKEARRLMHDFVSGYPQIRVSLCVLRLSPKTNISEFSHWMLNASPLGEGESSLDRRRTLLLVMDLNTAEASISLGYDAEALIGENSARSALTMSAPAYVAGRFAEGTRILLEAIDHVLQQTVARLKQIQESR